MKGLGPWALVGLLLLAGCSKFLRVFPAGSLSQPYIAVGDQPNGRFTPACVDYIAVFEAAEAAQRPIAVWRTRAAGDECVMLDRVVYGQTPGGFVVDTPPAQLKPDVVYEFSGHGWTTGALPRIPWYGGGRAVFQNGNWLLNATSPTAS